MFALGSYSRNVDDNVILDVVTYSDDRTATLRFGDERSRKLLESEWNLRVVVVGNQFVSALLPGTQRPLTRRLIDASLVYHGPGTQTFTLNAHKQAIASDVAALIALPCSNNAPFWALGQVRSAQYEVELRGILQQYSTARPGFMHYLPDYSPEPYRPCELSSSASDADSEINEAIRRNAVACEFTSIKDISAQQLQAYLDRKLPNYVDIMQEQ